MVREQLGQWVAGTGHRDSLAHVRDRVVDLLRGDLGDPTKKQNRVDDRNLKLLISFCLRPDSNCLEVGANRGKFLHDIERVAPAGHHIAYEPVPNQWERLVRLFPNLDIRQRALADQDGESRFIRVLDPGAQGFSRLEGGAGAAPLPDRVHTESMVVVTERLDGHVPEGWLPDFVKIDVEGAELKVIRGAVETLRKAKPIVAFEHGWESDTSAELYAILCNDIGLRLFDMEGRGPFDWSGFGEAARTRWNWVAHE